MSDLARKTIIITGASRGIGEATARHMSELGANVVLAARSVDAITALADELGSNAYAVPCDVSDWKQVSELISTAQAKFGTVDVLINNAGVIDPIARIEDSDPAAWGIATDINVKGVYHGMRAAIPVMVAQGHGTILNISSGAATGALEGWSHYCATKAAVLSLTRCGDEECRAQGLNVIGLSPGTVATDMQRNIRDSGLNPVSKLDPSVHIPADWVAKSLAYLCGPGGDAWRGQDFSLKSDQGRAEIGLPSVSG
ncbi:SDR family oxidoreductase [Parasedimentitalea huanghaiensis]|uniref:SDR family NAD(P)-dependent oxidoreductase n=1 Tax=Parasedimentitalea huanghaiensis TaxID=2682100 RepID=A0A6L6WEH7_9RHOB|nr:SDR family oxidoreductase [Zongyanglinia huanghaiensis]MVO14995.1 SDR family NAD(P)-dependent oxidoreductase [Zongyanglinia huanghaiensis]